MILIRVASIVRVPKGFGVTIVEVDNAHILFDGDFLETVLRIDEQYTRHFICIEKDTYALFDDISLGGAMSSIRVWDNVDHAGTYPVLTGTAGKILDTIYP